MNRVGFSFEVSAELIFTADEVRHLLDMSANHYDCHCRGVSKQGGFLWGMKTRFIEWAEDGKDDNYDPAPCKLSFWEVDTLCKILEGPGADLDLASALGQVCRDINEASRKVRET